MPHEKDASKLTPNQRLLLEYVTPGEWFDPDTDPRLIYVHNRGNTCLSLATAGILLKRPFNDLGYISFQYMLPPKTAKALSIIHREVVRE